MENGLTTRIDELIGVIKRKTDNIGLSAADMFIILTLEVLRGEIISGKLTEDTIRACREITATTSHFYYYRDHPTLYKKLQDTFSEIHKIDDRFFSADITTIGFAPSDWTKYLMTASKNLVENLPTSYFYNKNG